MFWGKSSILCMKGKESLSCNSNRTSNPRWLRQPRVRGCLLRTRTIGKFLFFFFVIPMSFAMFLVAVLFADMLDHVVKLKRGGGGGGGVC
jgi:hypothetical protein